MTVWIFNGFCPIGPGCNILIDEDEDEDKKKVSIDNKVVKKWNLEMNIYEFENPNKLRGLVQTYLNEMA